MKQIWQHLKEKWIRYLFEMIAVILGILGAFTLDNWGQERKDRREEIMILKEISEDLSAGLEEIHNSNIGDITNQDKRKVVIQVLANDLPYHDSLNQYFYNIVSFSTPEFPSSGFETLKSKGFSLISNDKLRRQLIDIFDRRIADVEESLQYDSNMRHEHFVNTAYTKYFMLLSSDLGDPVEENRIEGLGTNSVIVPVDYEALVQDQEFESLLREIYNNGSWMYFIKDQLASQMMDLKADVDEEIRRLD